MLLAGADGRMVVRRDGKIDDVSILHTANKQRLVPPGSAIIAMARAVRTCFGD